MEWAVFRMREVGNTGARNKGQACTALQSMAGGIANKQILNN